MTASPSSGSAIGGDGRMGVTEKQKVVVARPRRSPGLGSTRLRVMPLVTAMPGAITTAAPSSSSSPRSTRPMQRHIGAAMRGVRRYPAAGTPDETSRSRQASADSSRRTPTQSRQSRTESRHPSRRAGSWPAPRWRPTALAAPPPSPPRLSSITSSPRKCCSTTSVEYFSAPSLSVHLRVCSEPSR